ncbi:MAG: High-affinity Na(+)/H(+) antiporter NhaS3 [Verrucomicrobiae bacterium]|nr:High-affinity Na(+)/H(+) antiporter NhaS3 [Verrucomicrobiae bacterium]
MVGSLGAGLLLGPAALAVIPSAAADPTGRTLIEEVAHLGLCVLLFEIGLKTRFENFRPVWRQAATLSVAGMILSFLLAGTTATLFGWPAKAAVFAGATLTATSLSITASVLSELKLDDSREGTTAFGAAVLDNVLAMLLLAALMAVITPGAVIAAQLTRSVAQAAAFIAAGIFLGPFLVQGAIRFCRWVKSDTMLLVMAFSYLLLLSHAATIAGLAMITGAYAAGLAFARHPEREQLAGKLQPFTELLTPLFFVLVGASIEFGEFHPISAGALLLVTILAKLLAPLCLRHEGLSRWLLGSALIARGGIGFVFVQLGLKHGVFTPAQFSNLALVLAGTTVFGTVLLRVATTYARAISAR